MPFPGTRIIPTGWSRHHAPILATAMNGSCWVHDPARTTPGAFDPTTGNITAPTLHPVAGSANQPIPCRIQALTSARDTDQGDQDSTARPYLVQLHDPTLDLPDIEQGHVVIVTAAANDPHLVGLALEVDDVQHGTERFTRDLIAIHNQQPAPPAP